MKLMIQPVTHSDGLYYVLYVRNLDYNPNYAMVDVEWAPVARAKVRSHVEAQSHFALMLQAGLTNMEYRNEEGLTIG